jgi:hypothetical protein
VTALGGVLALRESWCAPDEPVLLCFDGHLGSTRFEVPGLTWWGRPERGAVGKALVGLVNAPFAIDSIGVDAGTDHPKAVVFGGGPDALAPRLWPRDESPAVQCVLTPRRLAWVREVEPVGPEPERSLLGRVGGFAKEARDALAGKGSHPPHHPVETVGVETVAEVPGRQIASVALAGRRLPREFKPRDVEVLRVSFVDGSGVDVLPGREGAQRLLALATGR